MRSVPRIVAPTHASATWAGEAPPFRNQASGASTAAMRSPTSRSASRR